MGLNHGSERAWQNQMAAFGAAEIALEKASNALQEQLRLAPPILREALDDWLQAKSDLAWAVDADKASQQYRDIARDLRDIARS